MDRKQIREEYSKMFPGEYAKPDVIDFAEHIAKQVRINTLQEVKDAVARRMEYLKK